MPDHYNVGEIIHIARFSTNTGYKGFVHPLYINTIKSVEVIICKCESDFKDYALFRDNNDNLIIHYYDRLSYGKGIDSIIFTNEDGCEYVEAKKYIKIINRSNKRFQYNLKYSITPDVGDKKKQIMIKQINVIRDILSNIAKLDISHIVS